MSSDMEELAREGMRQFTATMQVSPDLAARACERHRQWRQVLHAGLALGAAGAVTAVTVIAAVAHGRPPRPRLSRRPCCEPACSRSSAPPAATSCTRPHRADR
jgi:hypothetical protein